ncbi:MAG TPA: hypothetical protein VHM70_29870 [Polyangiaceae bacterium]|jgi:hypothetical protein|nr:hypothetical protein [Polyangiaceae bacterium]
MALATAACQGQRPSAGNGDDVFSRDSAPSRAPPQPSAAVAVATTSTAPLDAGGAFPAEAPLLDPAKAEQAVLAYRQLLKEVCRLPGVSSGKNAEALEKAGFFAGSDGNALCLEPAQYQRPLASGSLLDAGADEVLLEVPSTLPVATGEATLAVMRRGAAGYRLARHLTHGARFEARIRVVVPGHRDALLVCEKSGRQGLYFGTCGFFGAGSFDADDLSNASDSEIRLVDVTSCGPGASVDLNDIRALDQRILIQLDVDEFVRGSGPANGGQGSACSTKRSHKAERFALEYALDGAGSYRLATPLPRRVTQILQKY